MALVTVVFATVFLTGYLLLIQAVFASGGTARMQTFFAVDILLVVGIVVFWRGRGRIKAASERLTQALAKRPGAGPSSLPARGKFSPAEAYYKGRMALGAARVAGAGALAVGSGGVALAAGAGRAAAATGKAAGRPVTDSMDRVRWAAGTASRMHQQGGRPAAGKPSAEPTAAQRVQHRIGTSTTNRHGQLVRRLGAQAVPVATTGRTPATPTAATAARRAVLAQRVRPAGELATGPSSRPSSPPGTDGPPPAGQGGMSLRGGTAPTQGRPAGYDRVETNGTVTLVPHRPSATRPASAALQAPAAADQAAARLRARLHAPRGAAIALPGPAQPRRT
jgi:hypothetical protein